VKWRTRRRRIVGLSAARAVSCLYRVPMVVAGSRAFFLLLVSFCLCVCARQAAFLCDLWIDRSLSVLLGMTKEYTDRM
jgi:hypothetical protein